MILRFLMAMLAFLPLAAQLEGGVWDNVSTFFKRPRHPQNPSIHVLITMDKENLNVSVKGAFKGYDPRTGDNILVSKIGKTARMEVMDGGMRWGEEFPGVHQILIVPDNPKGMVYVDGIAYPGSMYFYDVDNHLSAVNKVDMESYLASIMSTLEKDGNPPELLNALAITSRTNAYYLAENPKNPYWAVDGSQVGYHGAVSASEAPAIMLAINETKHMILSQTGAYEGIVTPFLGYWSTSHERESQQSLGVSSKITLAEADKMAAAGTNAAQILSKAFPATTIQLVYRAAGTRH